MKPVQFGDIVRGDRPVAVPGAYQAFGQNNTGAEIPAGAVCYRGGWNNEATPGSVRGPSLFLASNAAGPQGDGVAFEAIPDGAWGYVMGCHEMEVPGFDTSAATIGDPVYLGVNGAITLTAPSATGTRAQRVGSVTLISATKGRVMFDMASTRDLGTAPGDAQIKQRLVTLTNAQVKALRATPQTLVPAPGAGKVLVLHALVLELDYGGTAYTIAGAGDDLKVKYTDGSGAAVTDTIDTASFLDATADTLTNGRPCADAKVAAASSINKALVLHNIGGAEYGGGHAATVLRATTWYSILSVGF